MKKFFKGCLILVGLLFILSIIFPNEKNEKIIDTYDKEKLESEININMSDYKNSVAYVILGNGWDYAKSKNIPLINFPEREDVLKLLSSDDLSNILENCIYVEDTTGFFSGKTSYKKTLERTKFCYYGELNDNYEPDGLGMLIESDPYNEKFYIRYIGYFEKGMYNGYGIKPEVIEIQGLEMSLMISFNSNPSIISSLDVHEGYFVEGIKTGDGISYSRSNDQTKTDYSITLGEFANDEWNGQIRHYILDTLVYEGETKNGEYHGYGIEYYLQTGKIKYKGEFKESIYDGEGILYDENGVVLHEGEFKGGDIK